MNAIFHAMVLKEIKRLRVDQLKRERDVYFDMYLAIDEEVKRREKRKGRT